MSQELTTLVTLLAKEIEETQKALDKVILDTVKAIKCPEPYLILEAYLLACQRRYETYTNTNWTYNKEEFADDYEFVLNLIIAQTSSLSTITIPRSTSDMAIIETRVDMASQRSMLKLLGQVITLKPEHKHLQVLLTYL